MWFYIAVDEIACPEELQGARQLLEKVPDDDLVETRVGGIGVLPCHFVGRRVGEQLFPLLDEQRQVPKLAVLHDEVDVGGGLDAVMECDDVRVPERLEDLDLAVEVFLQLLVQAGEFDGLDGNGGTRDLRGHSQSVSCLPESSESHTVWQTGEPSSGNEDAEEGSRRGWGESIL